MENLIERIFEALSQYQYNMKSELDVHDGMQQAFESADIPFKREYKLNEQDIVDFLIDDQLAIEVKIKGRPMDIFRQCERYCKHENVKAIILASSRHMGLPEEINGKPSYFFNLNQNSMF